MRVGLMLPPGGEQGEVTGLARTAEASGFDFLACGEHVFFHGPTASAFIALAAAAGATSSIRLLSALTVLPLYPVALAAKMIATLDGVSGGRFELGVGVGGEYPAEFEACGVPVTERGRRTDEALALLSRLLRGEPVHFAGRYTTVSGQRLQPATVQRPRPPIWIGGRREAAMRRAGRYGDVWLPYLVTPAQVASGLATARSAAADDGRQPLELRGAVFCWSAVGQDGNWARRTAADTVSGIYQQDLRPRADRYLLAGTPAEVAGRLAEYAAAGAGSVVFAPACPPADLKLMIATFASEVLPQVRSAPDSGGPGRA
ncbi:MAG: LLM class flavin-dependent oxidoreductase [Micromonosporaceae bacterium]